MSAPPPKPYELATGTVGNSAPALRTPSAISPSTTSSSSSSSPLNLTNLPSTPGVEGLISIASAVNNAANSPLSTTTATNPSSISPNLNNPQQINPDGTSVSTSLATVNNMNPSLMNGYGSSSTSMYGNRYGGYGGYGGYGMSGYGGMYGGMGGMPMMNNMINPNNPAGIGMFGRVANGGMSVIQGFEQSVMTFGRLSQLMQFSFESLHMTFGSVLRLVEHVFMLKQEMGGVFQTFTTLRFLHVFYNKCQRLIARLTGQPLPELDMKDAWNSTTSSSPQLMNPQDPNSPPLPQQPDATSAWAWLPMVITLAVAWKIFRYIFTKIWNMISPSPSPPLSVVQQQQQLQQHTDMEQAFNNNTQNTNTTNQPSNANNTAMTTNNNGMMTPNNGMMTTGMNGLGTYNNGLNGGMMGMSPYGSSMYGYGNGGMYGSSMYGSGYGGYGSSMYGGYGAGTGYGSSMYGGGMYGNGYGGYGGYGSPYGY